MKLYCNITMVDGSKTVNFGKMWGEMPRKEANARAVTTGEGLVVVDIDTKDLSKVDSRIIAQLPEPTVETTRGFHYYFNVEDSSRFKTRAAYSKHVDIRSDGGLVFDKYWGDEGLTYNRVGEVHEMDLELEEYLLMLMQDMSAAVGDENGELPYFAPQWSDPGEGQRHDACINYIIRDYRAGMTVEQVEESYMKWLGVCGLKASSRELSVMRKRMSGLEKFATPGMLDGDVLADEPIEEVVEQQQADIDTMIDKKEDIKAVISAISRVEDDFKREEYALRVKAEYKMPIKMVREAVDAKRVTKGAKSGVDKYFNGNRLVWDPDMQIFCEVNHEFIQMHGKAGFKQTLSSLSGMPAGELLNNMLSDIPAVYVKYMPDVEGEINLNGREAINIYKGVKFAGRGVKIPKMTGLILDSMFESDPKMKDEFINWLAFLVQKRQRSGVAWAFYGSQGTGKGIMTSIIAKLVGRSNAAINVGDVALQSQFNPYMHNKLFVHLNEITSTLHGRHGVAGKLKAYVSDESVSINNKGIKEVDVDNYVNIVLNSNSKKPLELDKDDRRWNMVNCKTPLINHLWFEIGDGDKAIGEWQRFGAYLMNYDLDVKRATKTVPIEESKSKQIMIARTTPVYERVAEMIIQNDAQKVIKFMELDEDDLMAEMIIWAANNKKWSSNVLLSIYKTMNSDKNVSKTSMTQHWILTYFEDLEYKQVRNAEEGGAKIACLLT